VFADDEEVQSVGEVEEEEPGYYPLLQTRPAGLVSASTLPAGVKAPYIPGTNKQQYLRGEPGLAFYPAIQTPGGLVGLQTLPSQILYDGEEREDYQPGTNKQQYLRGRQTLPNPIVFAPAERAPYVPGTSKQQYLRGRQGQPQYVPLIKAANSLTGVPVETLPSPIVFAQAERAPYVPGTSKQQYLRGRQTKPFSGGEYRPLIEVRAEDSVPVQSLPSGLVFAGDVPGTNRQQYLRNNVVAQTLPRPITFASEEESENFVLLTPRKETRPGPVARQPFLRSGERDRPGVSSRPSFPPGFRPRQFSTYSQAAPDQQYEGPKNVLYFFK